MSSYPNRRNSQEGCDGKNLLRCNHREVQETLVLDPIKSSAAEGRTLYLFYQRPQEKRYLGTHREGIKRVGCGPRQLHLARGRFPYHDAKICDGKLGVLAEAGMEVAGGEACPDRPRSIGHCGQRSIICCRCIKALNRQMVKREALYADRCSKSKGKRLRLCYIGLAGIMDCPLYSTSINPGRKLNTRKSFWSAFPSISMRTANKMLEGLWVIKSQALRRRSARRTRAYSSMNPGGGRRTPTAV